MKKKILTGLLSVAMAMSLMTGCGGSAAPSAASTDSKVEETAVESVAEAAASSEAEAPADESVAVGTADAAFAEKVSTFMAQHGRPTGDLIVDLNAPEAEELSEEEGEEMDRAMRAYKPGIDSLLVNNAKSFYYYEKLNSEQKEIYDTIYMLSEDPTDTNNIAALTLTAPPDDNYYKDTFSTAYYALLYDHPELFWLYGGEDNYLGTGYAAANGQYILYIGFTDPYTDYEKDMKAFNDAAAAFLSDIDLKGSDAAKADAIHDKLIDMVIYDDEVAELGIRNDLAHTAYGALVANSRGAKNTCVCDGYSLAYVYLCQQAGLETAFLCGMAGSDKQTAGGHAWSIVQIDGQWKEVDSCWDDWDDLFEALKTEFGSGTDTDSKKIMQAIGDKDFQKALEHYLNCVTTAYITDFNDVEAFVYPYDDGTALVLINESVHIRMNDANTGGVDAALMKLAPVAK